MGTSAACPLCDHLHREPLSPWNVTLSAARMAARGTKRMLVWWQSLLPYILLMVGVPKSSIIVKQGLRRDQTRPGDVVVLDFSVA